MNLNHMNHRSLHKTGVWPWEVRGQGGLWPVGVSTQGWGVGGRGGVALRGVRGRGGLWPVGVGILTCPWGAWPWPGSSVRWRSQTPPRWAAWGWSCCSGRGSRWCDSRPRCHWWRWASAWATPASGSTREQWRKVTPRALPRSQPSSRDKEPNMCMEMHLQVYTYKCVLQRLASTAE